MIVNVYTDTHSHVHVHVHVVTCVYIKQVKLSMNLLGGIVIWKGSPLFCMKP